MSGGFFYVRHCWLWSGLHGDVWYPGFGCHGKRRQAQCLSHTATRRTCESSRADSLRTRVAVVGSAARRDALRHVAVLRTLESARSEIVSPHGAVVGNAFRRDAVRRVARFAIQSFHSSKVSESLGSLDAGEHAAGFPWAQSIHAIRSARLPTKRTCANQALEVRDHAA